MRMRRRLCIYINRSVVQAGKLEVKMGELKQEVVEANVNSLQKELHNEDGHRLLAAGQSSASGRTLWFQVWESFGWWGEGQVW